MSVTRRLQLSGSGIADVLSGPVPAMLAPALTLGAYWAGGERGLMLAALGLPALVLAATTAGRASLERADPVDATTGLLMRDGFTAAMARIDLACLNSGRNSACFLLEIDDFRTLADRHGEAAADTMLRRTADRMIATLRDGDTLARLGETRFAICLEPVQNLDLEACIQLAGRLQAAIEEPVAIDGLTLYLSCSIGFCARSRLTSSADADWLSAATAALNEAMANGPSGIRAYSAELQRRTRVRRDLREEAAAALSSGQIQPWFQPQISTDTGRVTGFESLARWMHPVHGLIPPGDFLPAIEEAGLMQRLGEVMLYNALTAVRAWDAAGHVIPCVGVNFSGEELRDPGLPDRVAWELDRFDLAPDRLAVEILETVVSEGPDDIVCRTIAKLRDLGCRIDLDDFGTGNASIAAIRRFRINRIKIDRSFVTHADRDPEQQSMVAAILTMAERLDLETLAEGVETAGEHALLSQLGCDHVQGYGIAKPMPFDQTLDWIASHNGKLQGAPTIRRGAG